MECSHTWRIRPLFFGAVVALVAVLAGATMNWKILVFPGTLIPVSALLYLLSWWTRRTARNRYELS
jgi:hypothetical protein